MDRDLRRQPLRAESRLEGCTIAAAIIGSAVVSAGVGAYSANKAADKQVAAGDRANDTMYRINDQIRSDLSPYNMFGQANLPGLQRFLSGDPATVQAQLESMPGYQFTRSQGLKAVQNSASARGLGVSGAAQKGAASYATGLADSTFGAQFNRLLEAAKLGENAAAQSGSYTTQIGQSIAGNQIGQGNAAAGGIVGAGNAISGAGGGIVNALLLNSIMKGAPATPGMYAPVDPFAGFPGYGAR